MWCIVKRDIPVVDLANASMVSAFFIDSPLHSKQTIEGFNCFVNHKDQACQRCNKPGHKMLTPYCNHFSIKENVVFWSSDDPLSNFHNCEITVNNEKFSSSKSTYHWLRCLTLGRSDVADKVKNAISPSQAKQVVAP